MCLQDINFNNSQFNFEQEDTEAVFSHAVLPNKTERRHRMTKCIIIIIIIITLFQEDNIFGRVASLTYGPQLTNVGDDIIKTEQTCMYKYLQYVQI